jgi:hypothetical protein
LALRAANRKLAASGPWRLQRRDAGALPAPDRSHRSPGGSVAVAAPTSRGVPRWWWLVAFAYLYVVPYYPAIQSANELPRAYLVKAMVDHHRLWIDDGVARWGTTADVSPTGSHWYSNKAPGSSLLTAPAYALAKAVLGHEPSLALTVWLGRLVTGIVPTLCLLLLFGRFLARFTSSAAARDLTLVTYALGSMAMPYSLLFISHQASAVAVALAWMAARSAASGPQAVDAEGAGRTSAARPALRMAWAGLAAGWAPLLDYQAAFALLPLAGLVIVRLWRRPDRWRLVGAAAAGAVLPVAALLAYHALAFGSPWRTGYEASVTFATYHQHGFLGITKLRWEAFWRSMAGPDTGLLVFAPWLALSVPGLWMIWRRGQRGDAVALGGAAILYLLFLSSINFWRGGWQVGPRYITAMLPLLLPAVAVTLEAWAARRSAWVAVAACVVGVTLYAATCAQFPYFPERFANPMHDVTLRLWADAMAAPNPLALLGVPAPWSLLPYVVAIGGVVAMVARPLLRSWAQVALAVAMAGASVTALRWAAPSNPANEAAYQWVRQAMTPSP